MVCISYFASCVTENDRSLLVFMSQKVSQTVNVPVVTNTTHSINLTFDYLFGLSFIFSATAPAPVGPAPGGPAPVGPAPVGPAPGGPAPGGPAPVGPAPGGPAPVRPTGMHA